MFLKTPLLPMSGSTKGNVVAAAAHAVYGENLPVGFVPGHPIAGAEHTGVHAGKVDLFVNHKVILTPLPSSADWAVEKLIQLWQCCKSRSHLYGCGQT